MTTSTFLTRQRSARAAALVIAFAGLAACSGSPSKTASPAAAGSTTGNSAGADVATAATASSLAAAPAAPAAHAKIDPCSLLTDAEAGAAMGGAAKHETEPSKDGSNGSGLVVTENRCSYTRVPGSQLGYQIYVGVFDGANRDYFDQTAVDSDHSPLPGLGDAATADGTSEVYVFSKGVMVELYGSVESQDGMQGIAKSAIAKL